MSALVFGLRPPGLRGLGSDLIVLCSVGEIISDQNVDSMCANMLYPNLVHLVQVWTSGTEQWNSAELRMTHPIIGGAAVG